MSLLDLFSRKRPKNGLRIVTWNCRGALHRKIELLAALEPDVAVIQECATVGKWHAPQVSDALWCGSNPNKGLAVVAFRGNQLQSVDTALADLSYFIAAKVIGATEFGILGVWTKPSGNLTYRGQLEAAIGRCHAFLTKQPSLLMGDWNSSAAKWLEPQNDPHLRIVNTLEAMGFRSAYHTWYRSRQGQERHMTHRHNLGGSFHIDYCFIPEQWARQLQWVSVGGRHWYTSSDHAPLIVDIRFAAPGD